ncbi:MAG TPA: GtrA family protein [Usitatibacter sp.]|nr:GtrA family protein [Usitatibacter sp.]
MRSIASSSTTFFAELRRIARYFAVGGVAACVDIGLFMLFAQYLGMPYLRVAAATFVVATLVNYWLSIRFVFVSGERFRRRWELALVFAVSAVGLVLNQGMLALFVERLGSALLAAKLAATGVVFFWNYFARRMFVFGATR